MWQIFDTQVCLHFFQLLKTSFNWEKFCSLTNKKFIFSAKSKHKKIDSWYSGLLEGIYQKKKIWDELDKPKKRSYSLDRAPHDELAVKKTTTRKTEKKKIHHIFCRICWFEIPKTNHYKTTTKSTQITHTLLLVTAKIKHSEKRSFEKESFVFLHPWIFIWFIII